MISGVPSDSVSSSWRGARSARWIRFLNPLLPQLLLLLVAVAALVPYAHKASENGSAFVRWQNQVDDLFGTENIYHRHGYPNPPMMALILFPLVQLPGISGALVWYVLKAAMALLALSWTCRLIETPERPFPIASQVVLVLLTVRPILGDLTHGNVNLFILFLVVAGLLAFCRGRDLLGGTLLGLAIACKLTPLLFLPYFLWKRAWTVLAGCLLGLIAFFLVVPGAVLGWQRNAELLQGWSEQMIQPYAAEGKVLYTAHNNQSLPAVVLRLTTASPSFITYVNDEMTPVQYDNWLDLSEKQARWLIGSCMVLFAMVVVWRCRTPIGQRSGWQLPAEFGLIVLGMLLFSERTWKHHCVVLVLPIAVLLYVIAWEPMTARLRAGLIAGLALATLLMASTSTGLVPDHLAKQMQIYGGYLGANLSLLGSLVSALRPTPSILTPRRTRQ